MTQQGNRRYTRVNEHTKENKTLKVQQEITKGGRNTNNKPDVRDKETQRARGVKTEEGTNRNTEYS